MNQISEFGNRIEAQRAILKTINQHAWPKEQLFSLMQKSINRWVVKNQIDLDSQLPKLLTEASAKLFFLANKSQEQITTDYKNLSGEVTQIHNKIMQAINELSA